MNFARKQLSELVVALCLALLDGGCTSTVAPRLVKSAQASFDAGVQDSGIIAEIEDAETHSPLLIVTPHLRDRYNQLIQIYGAQFRPALNWDEGLCKTTTNTWLMQPEAFEHFAAMNRWKKQSAPSWFK